MAVNRYISLPEELNLKLKREDNASALISRLLYEYYKFDTNKVNEIEEKQKRLEYERKIFDEKYNNEMNKLSTKKKEIEVKELSFEEQKNKIKNKREELINYVKQNFYEDVGRYITPLEMEEYLDRWDNEKDFNYFKFIAEIKQNELQT